MSLFRKEIMKLGQQGRVERNRPYLIVCRRNPWGLDKSKIRGVGEEMWAASKVFASEAKNL